MAIQQSITRTSGTTNLAEILERVLDKGIVIAGDIRLNLGGIEILTLQIRLVICSVDKAKEMGMDWWTNHPAFSPAAAQKKQLEDLSSIEERLRRIEESLTKPQVDHGKSSKPKDDA
jgi:hypothetical protein